MHNTAQAVVSQGATFSSLCTLTNNDEWTPERGEGVPRVRGVVHIFQHGAAQRLGAADCRIGLEFFKGSRGQARRRRRVNRPVRHQRNAPA